jgi:hypothetical protein
MSHDCTESPPENTTTTTTTTTTKTDHDDDLNRHQQTTYYTNGGPTNESVRLLNKSNQMMRDVVCKRSDLDISALGRYAVAHIIDVAQSAFDTVEKSTKKDPKSPNPDHKY